MFPATVSIITIVLNVADAMILASEAVGSVGLGAVILVLLPDIFLLVQSLTLICARVPVERILFFHVNFFHQHKSLSNRTKALESRKAIIY